VPTYVTSIEYEYVKDGTVDGSPVAPHQPEFKQNHAVMVHVFGAPAITTMCGLVAQHIDMVKPWVSAHQKCPKCVYMVKATAEYESLP
jgi:hypothetical protein